MRKALSLRRAPHRFTLHRETLRDLETPGLRQAIGGSNSADSDCITTATVRICPETWRESDSC